MNDQIGKQTKKDLKKPKQINIDTIAFKWNRCLTSLWSKMSTFQDSVMQYKSAAMPMPNGGFPTTSDTF